MTTNTLVDAFRYFDPAPLGDRRFLFSWTTLLLLLGVFTGQAIQHKDLTFNSADRISNGALEYPDPAWWQFFTAMWTHGSIYHLLGNLALVPLLFYIERKYGPRVTGFAYMGAGIGASLVYSLFRLLRTSSRGTVVGASGALYGLIGLYVSESILNPERERHMLVKALASVGLLGAHIYEYVAAEAGVAVLGHAGGLVFGLGPALLYLPNDRVKSWERPLLACAGILMAFYFLVAPVAVGILVGDK